MQSLRVNDLAPALGSGFPVLDKSSLTRDLILTTRNRKKTRRQGARQGITHGVNGTGTSRLRRGTTRARTVLKCSLDTSRTPT